MSETRRLTELGVRVVATRTEVTERASEATVGPGAPGRVRLALFIGEGMGEPHAKAALELTPEEAEYLAALLVQRACRAKGEPTGEAVRWRRPETVVWPVSTPAHAGVDWAAAAFDRKD